MRKGEFKNLRADAAGFSKRIEALRQRAIFEGRLTPDPVYNCAKCQDTGRRRAEPTELSDTHRSYYEAQQITLTEWRWPAMQCECGVRKTTGTVFDLPNTFRDARLTNYVQHPENAHAIVAAQEWLSGKRPWLFCYGTVGSGKSRLAATLLNELAAKGTSSAFIRVPWLFAISNRSIDDGSKRAEAMALMDHTLELPVVVLDDVAGGEKPSDHTRGTMLLILDRRADKGLRTVLTSNLDLATLSEFYNDARIPSRIAGECRQMVEFWGRDWRVALGSKNAARTSMRIVERRGGGPRK